MALLIFNFDGTGNEPEDALQKEKKGKVEDDNISNILKLHFMCGGNLHTDENYGKSRHDSIKKCFYYQGVGTYGSWWQRLINQGVSPESKDVGSILSKAYQDLEASYQAGDQLLVTGFSRGAALARRFCSQIKDKCEHINDASTPFIYLAVFDTVASIGLPNLSQSDRPDYDVVFEDGCSLSKLVKHATHMVSLDDKRKAFQPTLMNHDEDRITELWFAGAHSDVGGGYYRDGLSDVALTYLMNWIEYQARQNDLINPNLKAPTQGELNDALPDRLVNKIGLDDLTRKQNPLGKNHQQDRWPVVDWLTLDDRVCCVIENDRISNHKPIIHHAVITRISFDQDYRPKSLTNLSHAVWYDFVQPALLGAGIKRYIDDPRPTWHMLEESESIELLVYSAEMFNHTGVLVEKDEIYEITADEEDTWSDASITCSANGWNTSDVSLGWKELPIKLARRMRRVKDADWFTLCATTGRNDKYAKALGSQGSYTVPKDGELTLFANDLKSKMDNNSGYIKVTVKRIV